MARINLLPWRDELRKQRQKEFISSIGLSALLTICVLGFVHIYIEGLISHQENRNQVLKEEIVELDKKIREIKDIEEKKAKLLAKIDLIQQLQESRPQIVHLFDEIPKVTPEGVYLSKFVQSGNKLTFNGKAQSNARVSAYMRSIDASLWVGNSKLDVIKSGKKAKTGIKTGHLNDFTMHAVQSKPQADKTNGKKI